MIDPKEYSMEVADCQTSTTPFELHSDDNKEAFSKAWLSETAGTNEAKYSPLDAKSWLPFAAERYRISSSLDDYIVVPTTIMPSDLPNKNGVAFPLKELSAFNLTTGTLSYKTWKGKPTYVEHNNTDPTKASGVIFDSVMLPMKAHKGNLWKVVALCGFDRKKNPSLVNAILTGERSSYSMGAMVKDYKCSICGDRAYRGRYGLESACGHLHPSKGRGYYTESVRAGGKTIEKLVYATCHDILGIETSSVAVPAYVSADSNPHLNPVNNFDLD